LSVPEQEKNATLTGKKKNPCPTEQTAISGKKGGRKMTFFWLKSQTVGNLRFLIVVFRKRRGVEDC